MRKVLFVIPPHAEMGDYAKKMRAATGTVPYGVLSIISYVKAYAKVQVEFKILDFNAATYSSFALDQMDDCLKDTFNAFRPDVVGISVAYNFLCKYVGRIAKGVKNLCGDTIVVAGGACTAAFYDVMLKEIKELDAVCHSEGELPVLELVEADDMRHLINTHQSWLTESKLLAGVMPEVSYIDNLDEIPPIDFDLVDLNLYGAYRSSFRANKEERELCLPIHTTRGCPFNCVFCIAASLHGKKVRAMSAERVISEVKGMVEKYGINVLAIEDDQFLFHKERAKKILTGLADVGLAIRAESGLTISFIDDEMANLLAKAGMEIVHLAVESGSDYVLKEIIDKPIKIEQISTAVENCRKHGILVHSFLVVGFPGEKEEHRQQTLDLINKVGFDWNYITCATPVRGSRLYNICKEKGYINEDSYMENAYYVSIINTEDFTAEYITEKSYLMNLELNFVNNYRLRVKDYTMAKKYFTNISEKYPQHAFAYYYLAQACKGLNEDPQLIKQHEDKFHEIVNSDSEWCEYARYFNLV
ncbi:MAG: B12-binding domain-containing radical SAM protein [Thermincolia bacterium]